MSDESILIATDEIDLLSKKRIDLESLLDFLNEEGFKKVVVGIDIYKFDDEKDNSKKTEFLYDEVKKIIKNEINENKYSYKIITDEKENYAETKSNKADVYFLLNYTGKREIAEIYRKMNKNNIINNVIKNDTIEKTENIEKTEDIEKTKRIIDGNLIVPVVPEFVVCCGNFNLPDMMIWQTAYSELYFSEKPFSKMKKKDLKKAIESYRKREKRHGR